MTRIAVDNEAGPNKNHTVVFLGSEKGIILKFLAKMNNGFLNDSLFLEELNVYNPDKYVALGVHMHVRAMDRNRETHGYSCYKQGTVTPCICASCTENVCDSTFPTMLRLSQPTNPPAPSVPVSSPDPSYIVKPESQMATLSFKGVLSGYTLPNHSY